MTMTWVFSRDDHDVLIVARRRSRGHFCATTITWSLLCNDGHVITVV
jgi:hypothetical protein